MFAKNVQKMVKYTFLKALNHALSNYAKNFAKFEIT